MRLLLVLTVIAALTALPALAQGNGNGNGKEQSDSSGNNGNGNGNGNANGNSGNSNAGGNGNGNSNGSGASNAGGNGNAVGNGNGNAGGNGNGVAGAIGHIVENGGAALPGGSQLPVQETAVAFSEDEARDAVNAGHTVSLGSLLPDVVQRTGGELIDAQLLRVDGFLVYALKVLSAEGRVTTEYYYAQSGRFIGSEP